MTITSWDGLISAWTGGSGSLGTPAGQLLCLNKNSVGTPAAYTPHSLWRADGQPGTGTLPTFGLSNGRLCKRTSGIGGIPFWPASAGKTNYIITAAAGNSSTLTNFYIFDRICDVYTSHTGTGNVTGLDATSRLATGEGAQIWIEVVNTLSAASNTLYFDYVNQNGVSKTTPDFTTKASTTAHRAVNSSRMFVPLAAGDKGVRSLTRVNLRTGTATGDIAICLVKPIVSILSHGVAMMSDHDLLLQHPQCSKIYDEACLMAVWYNPTAAVTTAFNFAIRLISV